MDPRGNRGDEWLGLCLLQHIRITDCSKETGNISSPELPETVNGTVEKVNVFRGKSQEVTTTVSRIKGPCHSTGRG